MKSCQHCLHITCSFRKRKLDVLVLYRCLKLWTLMMNVQLKTYKWREMTMMIHRNRKMHPGGRDDDSLRSPEAAKMLWRLVLRHHAAKRAPRERSGVQPTTDSMIRWVTMPKRTKRPRYSTKSWVMHLKLTEHSSASWKTILIKEGGPGRSSSSGASSKRSTLCH